MDAQTIVPRRHAEWVSSGVGELRSGLTPPWWGRSSVASTVRSTQTCVDALMAHYRGHQGGKSPLSGAICIRGSGLSAGAGRSL